MPFGAIGTPVAILLLTLVVPIAFRYAWPGGVASPYLFLVLTFTFALIVAASAIFWYFKALANVGISAGHPAPRWAALCSRRDSGIAVSPLQSALF